MGRLAYIAKAAAATATVAAAGELVAANVLVSLAIARKETVDPVVMSRLGSRADVDARIAANSQADRLRAEGILASRESEVVSIVSPDGLRLEADLFAPAPDSHLWAITVHGYTGRRENMQRYAARYLERGYGVLMPDLRGHGESEGAYIGMGWPDRFDIARWVRLIAERDEQAQIVLHGVSMGAATVMMASGEDLGPWVRAVVEDCGFTSAWDIFASELRVRYHLPEFPLLHTADRISALRAGYRFRDASALAQVARTSLPILFIHGSDDDFVPCEMVYRLYDACPSDKELYVVDGAGHGQALSFDPDDYFDRVFRFIDAHV